MPRKCPFDPTKKCGRAITACSGCDIRRKVGQKLLGRESPIAPTITVTTEMLVKEATCPYCLYTENPAKFLIRNPSGKTSEKRFRCPDCGEVMRRDTLFKQMSIEQYAEWIFDTKAWERVSFAKFKKRLKEMGISWQFWEHYKKHKAKLTGETESYQDYIERKQQEERAYLQPGED